MQVEKFHLGDYLRRVREEQKLSIRDLVGRTPERGEGKSVTAGQISRIENKKTDPGFETLQKIANLLDIPLVFVLDGSGGAIDTVTVVSTEEFAQVLPEALNREKLVQLLTLCIELTDEQVDAILGVAQVIHNFTMPARNTKMK